MILIIAAFLVALAIGVVLRQRLTVGAAILGLALIVGTAPAPQPQILDLTIAAQEAPCP